ncbi:MAG: GlsB/YeaQ/YmgE family stress response membrane protein [Byssovorax sp.]
MTLETVLLWAVVGLIAGWLASAVVGGGYGLIGDIVVGVVGAFVGGFLFRQLNVTVPFSGLPGTIFVAFIGAIVLLVALRLIRRITS